MIIAGFTVAFKWLHCILVAQAAILGYNEVRMDSVVISGAGSTATVAGALVVTGVTTATGMQINGATTITGSLTASTYLVMPARWIQKQATSIDVPANNQYSNITGLIHTFTALADRMYDINCVTEAVAVTNISSRVDVAVWDGTTMLSSQRSSLVSAGFSPNGQFVSLGSRWTGTLTTGSHTITCKYYFASVAPTLTCHEVTFETMNVNNAESSTDFEISTNGGSTIQVPTACKDTRGASCTLTICSLDNSFKITALDYNAWMFTAIQKNVGKLAIESYKAVGSYLYDRSNEFHMDNDQFDYEIVFNLESVSGCEEEVVPPYSSASASTVHSNDNYGYKHGQGALDSAQGWSAAANNAAQWWQWDLSTQRMVTGVVTQGRANSNQWVTKYKVSHSNEGTTWSDVDGGNLFSGNSDRGTKVQNNFATPVNTRYIRIEPTLWHGHISMRSGVFVTSLSELVLKITNSSTLRIVETVNGDTLQ